MRRYSEAGEDGAGFNRRLFADDAAQGFAFIDLCRKRFDVILMNPPFGDASLNIENYLQTEFPNWNKNLLCAFISRAFISLQKGGRCGAIFDRTAIVKSSYENFRRDVLVGDYRISVLADLGWEVLDAYVEAVSLVCDTNEIKYSECYDVRHIKSSEKGDILLDLIDSPISDHHTRIVSDSFLDLPNAVIGYDFPSYVIRAFQNFPSLSAYGAKAHPGLQLKSDAFGRLRAEIPPQSISNKDFVPMYNGGTYSPFYMPIVEVADWKKTGEHLQYHPSTRWNNSHKYFEPGIGYGKRGFAVDSQILPKGTIFTIEGLALFPFDVETSWYYLGLTNSFLVSVILSFFSGQHKHAGYVDLLPVPKWNSECKLQEEISSLARTIHEIKRLSDSFSEVSPIFSCNYLFQNKCSVQDAIASIKDSETRVSRLHTECNEKIETLFQLSNQERKIVERKFTTFVGEDKESDEDSDKSDNIVLSDIIFSSLSYLLGLCLGRWDARFATGEKSAPELPDPFAPLPVCPPGMLQNAEGLPAAPDDVPADYPLEIVWNGILVDDAGHPDDVENRLRDVLHAIWKTQAEAIETEACAGLGVRSLRDYFRKPAGFFADHLKRYSKSRRQAPIYLPLSTRSGEYTVWLYYHRLTDQTLFAVVNDYVEPKLDQIKAELTNLRVKPNRTTADEKRLEYLDAFELELREFRDELLRFAQLPWKPNLNDGVQITMCPLWRLFGLTKWQKTLKQTWDKLEKGDYDWAHLAYTIYSDRVREKCVKDKSLAIAHDLEELYVEPPPKKGKKKQASKKKFPGFLEDQ